MCESTDGLHHSQLNDGIQMMAMSKPKLECTKLQHQYFKCTLLLALFLLTYFQNVP